MEYPTIRRTQEEIDRVMEWAAKGQDEGTRLPGLPYEAGVVQTIGWIFGDQNEFPGQ